MKLNNQRNRVAGFAAVTLSMLSLSAAAQEPVARTGDFGTKGQLSVNVDLPFTSDAPQFAIYNTSQNMGGGSSTTVIIAPALDYFVAPNVSIGGQIGYRHESFTSAGSPVSQVGSGFVLGARAGINFPINGTLSFWPRLSLTYSTLSGGGASTMVVPLGISAPLLWHPASHFFLGVGPFFATDLSSSYEVGGLSVDGVKTTDVGLQAVVGGYFGL